MWEVFYLSYVKLFSFDSACQVGYIRVSQISMLFQKGHPALEEGAPTVGEIC